MSSNIYKNSFKAGRKGKGEIYGYYQGVRSLPLTLTVYVSFTQIFLEGVLSVFIVFSGLILLLYVFQKVKISKYNKLKVKEV